ncbi:hypothetical protein GOV12_02725 [Candidatus Pacearchaeota archaeon]|nr:hypothetical protein [Candidatus Pacearchaeota archaeon]
MENKHDYECREIGDLVEATHPAVFRSMRVGKVDEKEKRVQIRRRSKIPIVLQEIIADAAQVSYANERRIGEKLFDFGKNRGEIVDRLGRDVAGCETCQVNYGDFLDMQVLDSQRLPGYPRGPYDDREEADKDFLNIGPQVNEWL